jgi:hypothetical protein
MFRFSRAWPSAIVRRKFVHLGNFDIGECQCAPERRTMPISLGHSRNKTVSASIPMLRGDALHRVCAPAGIEAGRVWLTQPQNNQATRIPRSQRDRIVNKESQRA